ncbi:M23 family metallopeptidase [Helicobacter turcicus]|uniref:M23 family metallopeptidase n=1 Tax=Helicobacter turcicus TaxID=2867412 RepID=A0ABS7JPR2_9HELI|nr:M23 family metallopeptidase [Helicobacter turcicus]MBX7491360.1 M23 family metallopeptidase [Helicobacter turcicus]MBX7546227.1 M23 family metallopeptidase [Helicobacter turcicus]
MCNPNMKSGFVKILGLVFIFVLIGGGILVLSLDSFEKEAPKITIRDKAVWNLKDSFPIEISDNVAIKSYSVALIENGQRIPLDVQQINAQDTMCVAKNANLSPLTQNIITPTPTKSFCIGIQKPTGVKDNAKFITLEVSVTDTSKWNLFKGNTTTQQFNIAIDSKKPQLAVVSNSYKITQGGSALVIFRAIDENLENLTITNGNLEFKAQPFYKEGFYIALIAWSKMHDNFTPKIIAEDSAGNVSIAPIGYFQQKKRYKDSTIPLTDSFIDGKISTLVEEIGEKSLDEFESKVEIFRYINEGVRQQSFDRVFKAASEFDTESLVENFHIKPFAPLRGGAVMASFGDYRRFTYQSEIVSESHHMGLDLASIKQAPVILNNPGIVTLNEFVGIDGNSIVVYHGLGLSTLYAHLTTSDVNVGDVLESDMKIANTGNTGLALGDHLHFSVLVQGYEVWNAEWMDAKWIKLNITDVINEAKAIINQI